MSSKAKGVTWTGGPRPELREWLEAHGRLYGETQSVTLLDNGDVTVIEYLRRAEGNGGRYITGQRPGALGVACVSNTIAAAAMRMPFPFDVDHD